MRTVTSVSPAEIEDVGQWIPGIERGMLAALGEARLRIAELEKRLDSEGGGKIAMDAIDPNPWRLREVFPAQEMDKLVGAIRAGQHQPIVVRVHPSAPGRYQLVAGERRWRAHKILGWDTIAARVIELDDADMARRLLMENLTRVDLTDYEICLALDRIEKEFSSRRATVQELGISRSQVYRLMSFLKLPVFIRKDLDERPGLLGANAASALVGVLGAQGAQDAQVNEQLEQLWTLLKQGEVEQGKLARLLAARLDRREAASRVRYVRTFFSAGRKVGDMHLDGRGHLVLRLKESLLTEEQQKELDELLAKLFPPS